MAKKLTTIRNLQDKVLVTQTRSGKEQAYAKIYRKYVQDIYRFTLIKVSYSDIAEELTQDIFLKAWRYINKVGPIENVRALLYKIARNTVIDYYRKKKTLVLDEGMLENLPDTKDDMEKQLDASLASERLFLYIKQLKDEYREVIRLRFIEELSHREIADILNKNSSAVRVALHRAIKKLREIMQNSEDSEKV